MKSEFDPNVRMIPVKQIRILNPRRRGKKKFSQIVASIAKLGLKKPITVALAHGSGDEVVYNLVCGQGRLEAFIFLKREVIPALMIDGTKEELLLMSLAENLARRKHTTVELVREVKVLKERGYGYAEIARKTDLETTYIRGILHLLNKGEERLLTEVEKGKIPLSIAITIVTSDDKAIQRALTEAYERKDLRGKALIRARQLIENRRTNGKSIRRGKRQPPVTQASATNVLKTYEQETVRQKLVVQKAKISEARFLFIRSALKQLLEDENFVTLLRAESLDTIPQCLAPDAQI